MSSTRQHPTRQSIVIDYTLRDLALGRSRDSFADAVAENYLRMVPEQSRSLPFHEICDDMAVAEFGAARRANRKAVERYIKEAVHFPAELEEPWVATLSPEIRRQCAFALCGRYDFLPVRVSAEVGAMDCIARVMSEGAEAVAASSPIVADNAIDESDRQHVAKAHHEHMEAAAAHLAFAMRLAQQFPEECRAVVALDDRPAGATAEGADRA